MSFSELTHTPTVSLLEESNYANNKMIYHINTPLMQTQSCFPHLSLGQQFSVVVTVWRLDEYGSSQAESKNWALRVTSNLYPSETRSPKTPTRRFPKI